MQSASTKTFSINFPDIFSQVRVAWESIRGEHLENEEYRSFITIGLNDVSYYDKYPGKDLEERFKASCLEERGHVNILSDKTLPVAGLKSYIRTVESPEKYFFYFGILQIDKYYCYTVIGDCEGKYKKKYTPLFEEAWQSLQYFGNPAQELASQRAAIDALFKNNNASEEPAEAAHEDIPPFTIPEDGRDHWQFDDFEINILPDPGTNISVSDGEGALYIRLEGEMPNYHDDTHGHILNDYEDGKVYLQFSFKGIYKDGLPTGQFTFENDRDETYRSYLWKGGFHYSLNLRAAVTLQNGWLGINGYFNNYPIQVAVKIPFESIEWTKYKFLSIEELDSAPERLVRHIALTDPYAGQLQEALDQFRQVETLSIICKEPTEISEIPRAIKYYTKLQELTLSGLTELDSLPQWLGDLKELEKLFVDGTKIEGIHPYVFQLPRLKYAYLNNNRLVAISPSKPPVLETLTLENNRFTELPKWVTNLKYLNIQENPLKKLPAGIDKIPDLKLELGKKMTLLDYTYKGAQPYDNTVFEATALKAQLEKAITTHGLKAYKRGLTKLARHAVALATTGQDDYTTTGNTRIGGLPDLPASISYPEGMQFIAQLNCGDLAALQNYLPRFGMLYFFIQDQEQLNPRVIYYDGDLSSLQSAATLDVAREEEYTPCKVEAAQYPSVPFFYNARDYYQSVAPELEALEEMYEETEGLQEAVQSPVVATHSINSYVFKQHDTPEIEAVQALRGKPEDWMVLLRISSDTNTGFNFWDAGEIYFVIHKSDLVQKKFGNVYAGLESS